MKNVNMKNIKFGCFGNLADYNIIKNSGFNSIELGLEEINALSDREFDTLQQLIAFGSCKPHVVSRLMPLTERISDEHFDSQQWLTFFKKGAERTAILGTYMWVFGCGKPRSLPDNNSECDIIQEKIDNFILQTADILSDYYILLLLEPLGKFYSNYIGTVQEAVSSIEYYRHKNIATMYDLRHAINHDKNNADYNKNNYNENSYNENFDIFSQLFTYSTYIKHIHVDYPIGKKRLFPNADDGYDYATFFNSLRKFNYDNIITIEAPDGLLSEAEKSLLFLKNFLDNDYNNI